MTETKVRVRIRVSSPLSAHTPRARLTNDLGRRNSSGSGTGGEGSASELALLGTASEWRRPGRGPDRGRWRGRGPFRRRTVPCFWRRCARRPCRNARRSDPGSLGAIPGPVSVTVASTCLSVIRPSTVMVPPGGCEAEGVIQEGGEALVRTGASPRAGSLPEWWNLEVLPFGPGAGGESLRGLGDDEGEVERFAGDRDLLRVQTREQ